MEQEAVESTFRNYVTDSLRAIPQHKYLQKRYSELVDFSQKDTRSGDEIATDIIERAGLVIE